MKNIKLIQKKDWLLIAAILLIALFSALPKLLHSGGGVTAIITADNNIVEEIRLHDGEEKRISVNNTVIEIKDGEIYFLSSNCEDKICVRSGKLSKKGDAAACVPNRVAVYIKDNTDMDAVVY